MKRLYATALVVLLAVITVAVFFALRPREPVYEGRRLSQWLDQYEASFLAQDQTKEQARSAISRIGTNALPALLWMVSAEDSALKQKLLTLAEKQSMVLLRMRRDDFYHAKASFGFAALGPIAKPAVPSLIVLLSDKGPKVRAAAANALAGIGPEAEDAVPALLPCLDDRNNGILQMQAMLALAAIHKKAELAVLVLIEYVDGSRKEWNYAVFAMQALALYGETAKTAIPAIQQFVDDPNNNIKSAATTALGRINREVEAKAGAK